jgi:hypothetical protein
VMMTEFGKVVQARIETAPSALEDSGTSPAGGGGGG